MWMNFSWGSPSGLLAEISLLEANAQVNNENHETSAPLHTDRTSIVASSSHSSTVHEKSSLGNASVSLDLNSRSQCSRLSTNTNASCSASIARLLGSNPSEIKSGTSSVLDKKTNSLSASVHSSPLSCSTPVANSAASLRKVSLHASSKLNLKNWGLPSAVVQKYAEKKITTLFPWQVACLQKEKVLVGRNLIYSAPTSSGKTLVSELLMLKTVVDLKKKALYISPFVAVAREKTSFLKSVTEDVGIRVESFAGSSPPGGLKNCEIAICTIEKANNLVNRLIEDGSLDQLGIVVVDELHFIGDSQRGYLLELLLTKILYAASPIQIVGMSATLPSLEILAKWLRAEPYHTDFRPIAIKEHVKIGTDICHPDFRLIRKIDPARLVPNDNHHLIYLCLETMLDGHSVLIFSPTKSWCEVMAQNISTGFFNLGSSDTSDYRAILRKQLKGDLLAQVLERLKATPARLDVVLDQTIRFGVAFHHAGLTTEEKEIIEAAFRHGVIRVLIATSTLSSGVNLPARRVIIRTPIFNRTVIDPLLYRQMIGRAGRFGVDTDGDSYLICEPYEKHQVKLMLNAVPPPLKSCLLLDSTPSADLSTTVTSCMKRAMLEVIATGSASTEEDLKLYASCTLFALSNDVPDAAIQACVAWLVSNEFIRRQIVDEAKERLTPTQLGLACLASSLSPDESLVLLNELNTARKNGLILDSDLHLVYQITPTYVSDQMTEIDWRHYLKLWDEKLNESKKRVGEAVGVEERFLIRARIGTVTTTDSEQSRLMAIHRRFYAALALHELMNEVRLANVARTYKMNKGFLQSLQQRTATFAGMVTIFCHRLGWNMLYVLLEHFQSRLQFGVHLELCDLMRLPSMLSHTARLLYDAGLTNVSAVATASPENIEVLLKNACPFKSAKETEEAKKLGETDVDAHALVSEARKILQLELGVKIQWNDKVNNEPALPKLSQEKLRTSLVPLDIPNSIEKNLSTNLSDVGCRNSPKASTPILKESPILRNILTPPAKIKSAIKENLKPANITPDMFAESSIDSSQSFAESLHRSPKNQGVIQIPPRPPLTKAAVTKKCKFSTPPASILQPKIEVQSPLALSFSSDDSSVIPSSMPMSKFKIDEITTSSRLELFIKESMRQNCLAINVYKEKNSVLGVAVAWSCQCVNYIQLRERFDSNLDLAKVSKLKSWLEDLIRLRFEFIVYDIRSTANDLRPLFHHLLNEMLFRDVDLCQWLLEPSNSSVSLQKLSKMYSQQGSPTKMYRGREKILHECCALLDIFHQLKQRLSKEELLEPFVDVEMPMVTTMLRMEQIGIAFDRSNCKLILQILRDHLKKLEEAAHRLAGRSFSLTSTKEVSIIVASLNLCIEEKNPMSFINPLKKKFQPLSVSASLIKLGRIHPLPRMVVEFRKVSAIIQTIIWPLLQASTFHVSGVERIAGECEFRNATGRVNIVQPNLQHIPRPFSLSDGRMINVRSAFHAATGTTLLSADYSQLELRILAHLSEDTGLCSIFSKPNGDVFRGIVSVWKKKKQEHVTADERQQAKQICYGIVYGMGCKSLAEQLEVSEEEAQLFVDSFHSTYPNIQKFITNTINMCKSKGFVITLLGRRRFLPSINSNNAAQRAQAERQAVNTKIQGSAADLVKTAVILLNRSLKDKLADVHLVHQMHDELLFEIPTNCVERAARVVRHCMETAIPMKIRIPVAIKTGKTWGTMEPYT